jgi:hypothetical protein
MATPKDIKPPVRRLNTRVDPWGKELPPRTSGSVAKDIFPHLPSKGEAASTPTRRELPAPKGKR